MKTAVIALTAGGFETARKIAAVLPDCEVHGLASRVQGADVHFDHTLEHLKALFLDHRPIVGICAAGILIRAVAPLLVHKKDEPPVVSVAEDGSVAVPLLGGHHGANHIAQNIAEILGGVSAVTTAGDVKLGVALDEPPAGWKVANPEAAKGIAAALLAGEPVALVGQADWLEKADIAFADVADKAIRVTCENIEPSGDTLILHPPRLALGVGCERGCDAQELIDLVQKTLADKWLAKEAIACVTSLNLKADEAAVHAVAKELGVPARFFTAEELEARRDDLANPSDVVFSEVGCHGVAEGAALVAAGPESRLVADKTKSARATCAVALSANDIDPSTVGKQQGRLSIVGIGPGSPEWRTPAATEAIARASDVVGYQLYLDLVAPLIKGKNQHESALAKEEHRVRVALDLAAEGKDVALICSGDAGIYALATLAFELLDREDDPDWNRLAIEVVPGVSAIQAAAARIGAPIGHDFCTVSLSDLLTPWEDIVTRLHAVADGNFIVAFYNPVSQRRRTQLPEAQRILLTKRSPETPVVLARNLGRAEERITTTTLGALSVDDVDMLTLVLVGNDQTRLIERGENRWVYTPRGYAKKMETVS